MRIVTVLLIVLIVTGCNNAVDNDDPGDESGGISVANSGCKTDVRAVDNTQEGLEYTYDGESMILTIHHINADFNCAANIKAHNSVNDTVITIEEYNDAEVFAKCKCLYDLYYQFTGITEGTYSIHMTNLNDVVIDLQTAPRGSYYEERTTYPWVMY